MFPLSYAEEISASAEKHKIELQEFSPLVNIVNILLYCGNGARINAILTTFNVTYKNKMNYARLNMQNYLCKRFACRHSASE